jgi:hypothetical protein
MGQSKKHEAIQLIYSGDRNTMMEPEDANTPTTRLLNTSASKSRKRIRQAEESSPHQNKRKITQFAAEPKSTAGPSGLQTETNSQPDDDTGAIDAIIDGIEGDENGSVGEEYPSSPTAFQFRG